MKKSLKIGWLLLLFLAVDGFAQVEKQVEVTKAYVPSLERAEKLAVQPDMTDTMQLRPDIDYTVTPLSLQTTLATRPMRPAEVTYWEFNRPKPFYVKAGVGYPLQSVADFYASTQTPSMGYAIGYLHHAGRYADIKNDFGEKQSALRMENSIGGAAGKYVGKRLLEGEVNYTHRAYRRYGYHYPEEWLQAKDGIGYSDVAAQVRFGDDFQDMTRTNFEVALDGALFYDHLELIEGQMHGNENEWGVQARVGRALKKSTLDGRVGFRQRAGGKGLDGCSQQLVSASVRYARRLENKTLEAGVDYVYDRIKHAKPTKEHYLFPYLHLEFDLISDAVKPFVEVDGSLQSNDFRSLSRVNPYLPGATWLNRSTPEWEARGGLTGHSQNNRFTYRAFLAFAYRDNNLYWLVPLLDKESPKAYVAGWLRPHLEQQRRFTLGGELNYRPSTAWLLDASVRFYAYEDQHYLDSGQPEWNVSGGVRYEGRKVRVGMRAQWMGERYWSMIAPNEPQIAKHTLLDRYKAPSCVDLQLDVEWRISGMTALFVEGRNLLNADLYELPTMPEYGISAMAGVRLTF